MLGRLQPSATCLLNSAGAGCLTAIPANTGIPSVIRPRRDDSGDRIACARRIWDGAPRRAAKPGGALSREPRHHPPATRLPAVDAALLAPRGASPIFPAMLAPHRARRARHCRNPSNLPNVGPPSARPSVARAGRWRRSAARGSAARACGCASPRGSRRRWRLRLHAKCQHGPRFRQAAFVRSCCRLRRAWCLSVRITTRTGSASMLRLMLRSGG